MSSAQIYRIANGFIADSPTAIMGYEESVYLAKLAEQAERYEGKDLFPLRSRQY